MSLNVVLLVMLYVIRFSMSLQGLGKQRFCGISTHDNRYMEGEADVKVEDVPTGTQQKQVGYYLLMKDNDCDLIFKS